MATLSLVLAIAVFGGSFDPATTNAPSASRIIPISRGVYRMVQPDGQKKIFQLVDAKEGVLLGPRPWVGKVAKGRIDIWADPEKTGGKVRAGYTFLNGQLRLMQADGVTYRFPAGVPNLEGDVESLFPAVRARSFEKGSAGDIWQGDKKRIRLWFANPNSTGMFFAQLVLLLVALAMRFAHKRATLILGTIVAAASALGLLKTGSRGGLLACVLGLVCLALPYCRRICTKRGLAMLGVSFLLLLGGAFITGQAGRLAGTFTSVDAGNSLRLKVAKAAVQMFADAPGGWTGGEVPARHACLNWYVFDETHTLRTHLMTLAELGWIKGWGYLAFWGLLIGLGVTALRRGFAEPLAFAASFAVAGFLNPVYREWELWILPAACGVLSLGLLRDAWRRVGLILVGAVSVISALGVGALIGAGRVLPRPVGVSVRGEGAAAIVNGDAPKVWVVEDSAVLGGLGFPGREILSFYQRNKTAPALGYVRAVDDLPPEVDTLVLPGRAAKEFLSIAEGPRPCRARRIVFLSPSVGPDAVPERLLSDARVEWIAGRYAAARAREAYGVTRPWVKIRLDCELYLQNWLQEVLAESPKSL